MEYFFLDKYDIAVVGLGHAGTEAALAAARLGKKTLACSIGLDGIAFMPCNPSIGGPAKGHLVREIDALGGEMGIAADAALIQYRLLNTGKGPAVQAPRAQMDKRLYQQIMKKTLENQENLSVKQLLIEDIKYNPAGFLPLAPFSNWKAAAQPLSDSPPFQGGMPSAARQGGACETADFSSDDAQENSTLDSTPRNCSAISTPLKGGYDKDDFYPLALFAETGEVVLARAAIISAGTHLGGKIIIGEAQFPSGPNGQRPALKLTAALERLGLKLMRFKTGTPARVHRASLDFSKMAIQPGDVPMGAFSFLTDKTAGEWQRRGAAQTPCHLSYTTETTHKVILDNIHRAPMINGSITGIGPRYCPSIESKIMRFPDKDRHQLFIEPEGRETEEMYVQGMSTSLPADVQLSFLRTIPGFERVEIMRHGYAIEYDCLDPLELKPSLETKKIPRLYSAGQTNGTSGYEEAAAQGLIAGINAARALDGLPPIILSRADAYIGVLIDDLVTKGTNEPYRMMTSRAEYRLVLRQDNADLRLTALGREIGLVDDARWEKFCAKKAAIDAAVARLKEIILTPNDATQDALAKAGIAPLKNPLSLYELLKRQEITYQKVDELAVFATGEPIAPTMLTADEIAEIEITAKYDGYIKKQNEQIARMKKLEAQAIPPDFDYASIGAISSEAREKLAAVAPVTVAQAARISGVSPADISVLIVALAAR